MRTCKEQFKEFERHDVKYREDFKHMKQKIKKLEDKLVKVCNILFGFCDTDHNCLNVIWITGFCKN